MHLHIIPSSRIFRLASQSRAGITPDGPASLDFGPWGQSQPWIRENFAKHFDEMKDKGGVVEPDAIAEQYWQLVAQRKEAWTHEMELRPWLEKW